MITIMNMKELVLQQKEKTNTLKHFYTHFHVFLLFS